MVLVRVEHFRRFKASSRLRLLGPGGKTTALEFSGVRVA
jgi:hypothetical protein